MVAVIGVLPSEVIVVVYVLPFDKESSSISEETPFPEIRFAAFSAFNSPQPLAKSGPGVATSSAVFIIKALTVALFI